MINTLSDGRFTINDLVNETGLKKRTIHYYSKNGIIPPPQGAGIGSFYTEIHLLRLKLMRHMKQSHLKLSGIKEAFNGMTVDELTDFYTKVKSDNPEWRKAALENWMLEEKMYKYPLFQSASSVNESDNPVLYKSNYMENIKRKKPDITQWEKIVISDGVELQIRKDKLLGKRKILEKLERIIGEITEVR